MQDRQTVFIHIGVPKTGTTYLQGVLHSNRAALQQAGLLYPGPEHAHFWASQDLRETRFHNSVDRHVPGAWDRLVNKIKAWPGRALIDHETFCTAQEQAIARAFSDLDFAEVHVVVTARDLARQLPAAWQERIKNGGTGTFSEFLASVQADRLAGNPSARAFWTNHDVPRILARWGRDLPPERVHVVTVPPAGADRALLWQRFAQLLGVEPGGVNSRPRSANTSLGAAGAAVLRRVNVAIADQHVPWPAYAALIKNDLALQLAAQPGAPIEVPEPVFAWAVRRSERTVDKLRRAGYDVIGDLDDLIPKDRPVGLDPDAPPAEEQVEAAAVGMASLISIVADSPRGRSAVRRAQRGAVARRAEDVVARVPLLGALRDTYRRR